jgi:hypothetical protein
MLDLEQHAVGVLYLELHRFELVDARDQIGIGGSPSNVGGIPVLGVIIGLYDQLAVMAHQPPNAPERRRRPRQDRHEHFAFGRWMEPAHPPVRKGSGEPEIRLAEQAPATPQCVWHGQDGDFRNHALRISRTPQRIPACGIVSIHSR